MAATPASPSLQASPVPGGADTCVDLLSYWELRHTTATQCLLGLLDERSSQHLKVGFGVNLA